MTPYIIITVGALGLLGAIPLVLHWERRKRERRRRQHDSR